MDCGNVGQQQNSPQERLAEEIMIDANLVVFSIIGLVGIAFIAYLLSPFWHAIRTKLSRHARLRADAWEGRIRPMKVRRFTPDDLPHCHEIYRLNERGRFPEGYFDKYSMLLSAQKVLVLVFETEEGAVATGGIHCYVEAQNQACLCFGLVHPKYQGTGIGTTLLLIRLALLSPKQPFYVVSICALENSIGFYRRFGFADHQPWKDQHGNEHPSAYLFITSREIRKIRKSLAQHGVSFPQNEDLVPHVSASDLVNAPGET